MKKKVVCILVVLSMTLMGCTWLSTYEQAEQAESEKNIIYTGETKIFNETRIPLAIQMETGSSAVFQLKEGEVTYMLEAGNDSMIQIVYKEEKYPVEYAESKDIGYLNIYYNGIVSYAGEGTNKKLAIVMVKKLR